MSEDGAENWFILPYDDPEFAITLLTNDGIPGHAAKNAKGIMFPSSSATRVLELLDMRSEFTVKPTGRENVFIIEVPGERPVLSEPPSDNLERWTDLVPVLKGLDEVFGIQAVVDNPHGSFVPPNQSVDDRTLYIHFWSAPEPKEPDVWYGTSGVGDASGLLFQGELRAVEELRVTPQRFKQKQVLGYELANSQKDFIQPSGVGHVFSDEGGTAFAEYVDNNLYILFDLPHSKRGESDNVTELFAKIVETFLTFKNKAVDEIAAFKNIVLYGTREGGESTSKAMFVQSCSKLYDKNLKEMELLLEKYDSTIDKHNCELVKASRDRAILFDKYVPLKRSAEERQKWAANEYDALCASPHVEKVVIKDKIIQVYTDMVSIQHSFQTHNIGKFRIDINTEGGGKDGVSVFNLTNKKKRGSSAIPLHHPHVIGDNGTPCLGNISEGVVKLLIDYQYVVLAQIMIDYLHTYNPDSAYAKISEW
jgi:hypothetical protein